jgi:hypothetical protein
MAARGDPEDDPHLFLATPCYDGRVTTAYAHSLLALQDACLHRGTRLSVVLTGGDALITRARQNLVARFLESPGATHLLFVDADIAFEPRQVFRLLERNAQVAAGVYPTKRLDLVKFAQLAREGCADPESQSLSYVVELDNAQGITVRDGFVRARYVGTGFMMIRRSTLTEMIERYPELRYQHEHSADEALAGSPWRSALFNCVLDEQGYYLSEDFSFCRRWTDLGGEIWADVESRLSHVGGSMTYHGDYSLHLGISA